MFSFWRYLPTRYHGGESSGSLLSYEDTVSVPPHSSDFVLFWDTLPYSAARAGLELTSTEGWPPIGGCFLGTAGLTHHAWINRMILISGWYLHTSMPLCHHAFFSIVFTPVILASTLFPISSRRYLLFFLPTSAVHCHFGKRRFKLGRLGYG